jgi:predicted nucleic acid-binding Zn ribbon protein
VSNGTAGTDGDGWLFEEINRLVQRLGGQSATGVAGIFSDWPAIVGDDVARNVKPVKLVDGRLLVSVADPAWSTQVRFLEADIIAAIVAATPVRVTGVDVRVVRHPRRP